MVIAAKLHARPTSRARHLVVATFCCVATLFAVGARPIAAVEYDFILIEAFEIDYDLREVILRDIDEAGAVIGSATQAGSYDGFVWTSGTGKVSVPLLWPIGMNNFRQAVASGTILNLDTGTTISVPPAGGYPLPRLQGINDNGIAVGYSECACSNSGRTAQTALLWDGATSRTIPVPNAKELLRINDHNVAIGNIRGGASVSEGFVYDATNQTAVNLSDLLPPNSYVRGWSELQDISDAGLAVGRGWNGQSIRGLTWSAANGVTFLPAIPGGMIDRVYPRGVNASGTVVGFADKTLQVPHAFIWTTAAGMRDLNDLVEAPPNFILDWAVKINDRGWIIGIGHYGPTWSTSRGFVLKPHEPTTSGIATAASLTRLQVTPNPVRDVLFLQFALPEARFGTLEVFDVAGRKVARLRDGRFGAGPQTVSWPTSNSMAAGVYYARLATAEETRIVRFVVVR